MKSKITTILLTISFSILFFTACSEDNNEPVNQGPNLDEVLFYDGFESGNLKETNEDGFDWLDQNRTSIVTQSETDGNVVVLTGGGDQVYNVVNDDRDWTAFDGENSMRFRYPAGEAMSEQRFDLGSSYPKLWFSFWLRVPTNYLHMTNNGNVGGSNHKLFAVWMDGYSAAGDGPTVIWNPWSDIEGGATLSIVWSEGGFTVTGGHKQHIPFISYPSDQGRWMHLVFHLSASTNDTSNDGVIEMWRRWENETRYTQFHQVTDANIAPPEGGTNGWAAGYILGWANTPYDVDTEWLLDEFVVSETSLLPE